MCAGYLNKLKPRLPHFCLMHRLCSVAWVTYSEFGLTLDSKITARYSARVAELESRGHPPSCALSYAPFCHLHPRHGHKDNTPPSPLSAWHVVPPFPIHRPCGATIISNPPLALHTTPYLTRYYSQAALLLRFQGSRRGLDKTRHGHLSTKQNTACAPPCGAIPATSTPSLGAWGSIPHHHTVLVICVTSTVTSDL